MGTNRKTGLKEAIKVIAYSLENAVLQASTFADNIYQERKPTDLGKDWNGK